MRAIHAEQRKGRPAQKILAFFLTIALIVSTTPLLPGFGAPVYGADELTGSMVQPVLAVTGQSLLGDPAVYSAANVGREKSYTLDELKALEETTRLYSAINTMPTKSRYLGKGITIDKLLQAAGLATEQYATTPIDVLATDGYTVRFDPTYSGDSATKGRPLKTPAFSVERFYYPNIKELNITKVVDATLNETTYPYSNDAAASVGKSAVPTMLVWEKGGERGQPEATPTTTDPLLEEEKPLLLMVGQQHVAEINNPLFNKTVNRILAGAAIAEKPLTIGGVAKTRAEMLLMPRADRSYTYGTSSGNRTDYVRGVPLAVLLASFNRADTVHFTTVDNYPAGGFTRTVAQLIDSNCMLAYERGTAASNLAGIYDTDKNDPTRYGFFSLYGDGDKPNKLINSITVVPAAGIDFSTSPYKHITNGGLSGQTGPYDIDAITGATLTIEGPGVKSSVPLPVRELETQNAGAYRGTYTDQQNGQPTMLHYEGIKLSHILNNMGGGANGIVKTDKASRVLLKNRLRQTIAEFTLAQIAAAEAAGKPVIIAYGAGTTDDQTVVPFVFDGAAGLKEGLGNGDGPIKAVYDKTAFATDPNPQYTKFGNVAYIYVAEATTPGYKHDTAPYDTPENSQYVLTVTGDKIGREVNYTVQQLENLVAYDADGAPAAGSMGYRDEYSLSNSTYWYVNEYEGVKLWELLQKSGLPATTATDPAQQGDLVSFTATDNYKDFDKFTIQQVSDPNQFKYYEKNPADLNDGTYTGNDAVDMRQAGYPVLVAYGVNGYPYVVHNQLPGYLSGLANDGGPLRIISGKMNYTHANGSRQAKLLDKVIVGEDKYYSTHKYNPNAEGAYQALANQTLTVKVVSGTEATGSVLTEKSYTVGQLEDLLYGGSLTTAELKSAKIKAFYEAYKNGAFYNDLYEGVNLAYFLEKVVQIPGAKGTVTFSDGTKTLTQNLDEVLLTKGANGTTRISGLAPVLAFAKNGTPMVAGKTSPGYEDTVALAAGTPFENAITVKNSGGPLAVMFPRATLDAPTADSLNSIKSITVNLVPDKYAHTEAPYNLLAGNKLTVSGEGTRLSAPREFSVVELEGKQTLAATGDYNIRESNGDQSQWRYRGIVLSDFLGSTDVGLKPNADQVIVTCGDDSRYTFSLADVIRTNYLNGQNAAVNNLKMILAYGSAATTNADPEDGKPLVADAAAAGYDAAYGNGGGPLCLVVGQNDAGEVNAPKILKNVVGIEVTASAMTSWNHSSSAIYQQYLGHTFQFEVVDAQNQPLFNKTYTVGELEAMTGLVERDSVTWIGTQEWEGLNLWDFALREAAAIPGIADPISVTVSAGDGFSKELRSTFGMDALNNGIADGARRVPIMLGYAVSGYPLVPSNISVGYTSAANNGDGPLRLMTHLNQGACLKNTAKLVVKVSGTATPTAFTLYPGDGQAGRLPLAGVRSISAGPAGALWVGTYGGGVGYRASGSDSFTVYNATSTPPLASTVVSAVAADSVGGVWMTQNASYTEPAKNRGVLYMKNGVTTEYRAGTNPATIPNDYVQEIQIDKQGKVWFGSFGGLTRYDPASGVWTTWNQSHKDAQGDSFPALSVDNLAFDGKGGVWLGFYPTGAGTQADPFVGGFAHMTAAGDITSYPFTADYDATLGSSLLAQVWVRDIAADQKGGAWVVASGSYSDLANVGGTVWYVDSTGKATRYTGDQLLGAGKLTGNSEVRMAAIDPAGGLWLGSSADGVFHIKDPSSPSTTTPLTITARHSGSQGSWPALATWDNVYSLDFIGNTLYVGSSAGLASRAFTFPGTVDPGEPTPPTIGDATEATHDLAIVGPGVKTPAYFTVKGLKNAPGIVTQSRTYSWQNSYGTTGKAACQGVYIDNLLNDVVTLTASARSITVTAKDGYSRNFNIDRNIWGTQWVDRDGNKLMLAWNVDGAKVMQLIVGQSKVDEINKPNWVSDVAKITVNVRSTDSGSGSAGNYKPDQPAIPEAQSAKVTVPVIAEIKVPGRIADGRGEAEPTVGEILAALEKINQAKVGDDQVKKPIVQIDALSDLPPQTEVKEVAVTLPREATAALAAQKAYADVGTPLASLRFSPSALGQMLEAGSGDGVLTIKRADNGAILFDVKVGARAIADFPGNQALGIIPLADWTSANPNCLVAVYRDGEQAGQAVRLSKLMDGTMRFVMAHTGAYAIEMRPNSFTDIQAHWARPQIDCLAARGIVNGKSSTIFDPDGGVTRAEFLAMLAGLFQPGQIQAAKSAGFSDVPAGVWYESCVNWAVAQGVVKGYGDGRFDPEARITREQMAVMTANLVKAMPFNVETQRRATGFSDQTQINPWSVAAVTQMQQSGVLTGMPNGSFVPQGTTSRAEAATVVTRLIESLLR